VTILFTDPDKPPDPDRSLSDPDPDPEGLVLALSPGSSLGERAKNMTAEILGYLSKRGGRHRVLKVTAERVKRVKALLSDGWKLDDFKVVIWSKCHGPNRWLGTEDMDKHLCFETLFRPAHAQKYREQAQREFADANPGRAADLGCVTGGESDVTT